MSLKDQYADLKDRMQRIADVQYSAAVLNWDQEVNMPEKGAAARSRQLATLMGIAHNMFADESLGQLLGALKAASGELAFDERRNVEEALKAYDKNKKLPQEHVEELTRSVSRALHSWQNARKASDFSLFRDDLAHLVDLKRKEAGYLGYEEKPYDALLDQYEPGATVAFLDPLFENVKGDLRRLLEKVQSRPQPVIPFEGRKFDADRQWPVGIEMLKSIGYDFTAGRQDLSSHPFTTNFSSQDVRVTTRINEDDPLDMITSCIHEGGHAIYEQGLKPGNYGMPQGEYVSLGVHESQSRLYENNVGRSLAFWECHFPLMQQAFPDELGDSTARQMYEAANKVSPSLIRVQADELTYHFHILIRYEIEKALIHGDIQVDDLPSVWNAAYKKYLGVDVPDDAHGVLQDIHWSHGSFGYFPTYSLGSFYAAQYFAAASEAIGDLDGQIRRGELLPLRDWLNEHIHQHGKLYSADELCRRVTGSSLDSGVFMKYIEKKLADVYGF